ncbi:hypothetical protein BpHYR1_003734 [Brachionus plicatilis]|uniref:Uncharacterized protein n=1 Tax=Brachionus plicatilis TaxID=10195 RepID=A0A3M7QTC7_BRAPC|nr:hypothetical protein BpHYR1_003734 [Brachionus plicatilis]
MTENIIEFLIVAIFPGSRVKLFESLNKARPHLIAKNQLIDVNVDFKQFFSQSLMFYTNIMV